MQTDGRTDVTKLIAAFGNLPTRLKMYANNRHNALQQQQEFLRTLKEKNFEVPLLKNYGKIFGYTDNMDLDSCVPKRKV